MPSAIKNATAAIPSDNEILNLIYSLNAYTRDEVFYAKGNSAAADRRTIVTPAQMIVGIDGGLYQLSAALELDLDTAANWDSAETTYATAANRAGKDVYIYACTSTVTAPTLVLSCNSTFPGDYTADTSRKIAGFHCLCVDAGATPGDGVAGHPAANYLEGDIIPLSVWDLLHRPKNLKPEGMALDDALNMWADIYLDTYTGGEVKSIYDATPWSGVEPNNDFHWYNWVEHLAAQGKRPPYQHEFMHFALGSNQETNIFGSSDVSKTGGRIDTSSRRMISNYFLEDCCGNMYQWGADTAATPGTTAWAVADTAADATTYDGTNSIGRGQHYEAPERPVFGGSWGIGANCGSRCSSWAYGPLDLNANLGARGVCEPL